MFEQQAVEMLARAVRPQREVLLDEPARLKALIRDVCGHWKRECNLLMDAVDAGIPAGLVRDSGPLEVRQGRLRQRMEDHYPVTAEVADWAVQAWTKALGLGEPTIISPPITDPCPDPEPFTVPPVEVRHPATAPPVVERVAEPLAIPLPGRRRGHSLMLFAIAPVTVLALIALYLLTRSTPLQRAMNSLPGLYDGRVDYDGSEYVKSDYQNKDESDARRAFEDRAGSLTLTIFAEGRFNLQTQVEKDRSLFTGVWEIDKKTLDVTLRPRQALDPETKAVKEDISSETPMVLHSDTSGTGKLSMQGEMLQGIEKQAREYGLYRVHFNFVKR